MGILHDGEPFQPIRVSIDYLKNIQDPATTQVSKEKSHGYIHSFNKCPLRMVLATLGIAEWLPNDSLVGGPFLSNTPSSPKAHWSPGEGAVFCYRTYSPCSDRQPSSVC